MHAYLLRKYAMVQAEGTTEVGSGIDKLVRILLELVAGCRS